MKRYVAAIVIFVLITSMFIAVAQVRATVPVLPDYEPVDWQTSWAGTIEMPTIDLDVDPSSVDINPLGAPTMAQVLASGDTPPVGTKVWDWYLYAISRGTPTGTQPYMTLRAISDYAEVWVQDYLWFLPGDPRNEYDGGYALKITDEMCQYLAEEFDRIYEIDTTYFGKPFDRDGTNTIFEELGWPPWTYDWIATDNPQRVILKVLNIRDTNYYDPTYPYYVAGFYSSTYTAVYYNRNMIHIDAWRWWQRLGPAGKQWFPERPDLVVTRPYLYEAVTTHEYQHNIHRDWNPEDDTFMNEGCSMYAELICGYGIDPDYFNFYFGTPDNSLTEWGDQGDINILADYGVAALWVIYLSDHYGGADLIRYFVQSGIPGIEGINNALAAFGYKQRFEDVYHDWRLANLIRKDFPGCKKYNYKSINLNDPEIIPVRIYEVSGLPVPWTKGTDFGTTKVWYYGYDTGVSKIGPFGTDYIALKDWTRPGLIYFDGDDIAQYGWTYLAEEGVWWSGADNLMDTLLVGKAYVDPTDPTLVLKTYWDIEEYWDFGFVQVSTDGGKTWTSLENEYTTYEHDPEAHPAIIANLPGLTGWSGDWITMDFDLTAYAGMNILVGFRYMTDWATLYEGWYIASASVSGVELTLTPVYPEADFQVTIVYAYIIDGMTLYIPFDMWLCDKTETGVDISPTKKPNYTILVISPTMRKGWVDYKFKAEPLPLPKRCILDKLERFEGILR
ncbi:MAG: immune inhibitor A [Candidatus Bathyarchaeia archaeon]